jgi:pimeloyl-ACP methyl ester carboxylesterase
MFAAYGRPWRATDEAALDLMRSLGRAPWVLSNLTRIGNYRFEGGEDIDVPVTVSWGTRDLVLPPQQVRVARRALPQARMVPLPGCGHVPMSDDPALVAQVILEGSGATGERLRATS